MAPYVVYKGARVSPYHTIGGPLGTRYKATENGWMNADTFLDWFQLIFIPSLPSCRPVLLLLDGHKSHVGYQIRKVAQENNIHILKLPAHTTHLLQPLDVGVFNHLKRVWQATLGTFTRQEKRIVKKVDFPKLLAEVWQNNKPEWAVGGFQKAGVVPYNPESCSLSSSSLSVESSSAKVISLFSSKSASPPSISSGSSAGSNSDGLNTPTSPVAEASVLCVLVTSGYGCYSPELPF